MWVKFFWPLWTCCGCVCVFKCLWSNVGNRFVIFKWESELEKRKGKRIVCLLAMESFKLCVCENAYHTHAFSHTHTHNLNDSIANRQTRNRIFWINLQSHSAINLNTVCCKRWYIPRDICFQSCALNFLPCRYQFKLKWIWFIEIQFE